MCIAGRACTWLHARVGWGGRGVQLCALRCGQVHITARVWCRSGGSRGAQESAREHQRALDLLDRLGHLDAARAGLGAVERGAAAPHPVDLVEDVEALGGGLVAAVEDEPVRVDDRGRAEVASPRSSTPGSWWCSTRTGCTWWCRRSGRGRSGSGSARGSAGCRVVIRYGLIARYASKNGSMLTTRSFSTGRPRIGSIVMVSCLPGFLLWQQVAHQHLAGQPVDAVDAHGVRAAHAVRARPPERQRAVQVALDVVQQVQQPVAGQARHPEALPAGARRGPPG